MTRDRPQSMFIGSSPMMTSPNHHHQQHFYLPPPTVPLTRDQQNLNFQRINFLIEDAEDYLYNFEVLAIAPSRRKPLVAKADRLIAKIEQVGQNQLISDLVRDKIRTLRFKLERRANNLCHLIDGQPDAMQEESEEEEEDGDEEE